MDTVVFTDPKAIEFFTNEMLLVKVDAEADTLTKQRYNIMGYPTSVLVNAQGEEVDRLIGFAPAEEYIGTFRNYAQGIGTLSDLVARFEVKADRDSAYAIAEKYKYRGEVEPAEAWYGKVIAMGEPVDSLSGEARMAIGDMYLRNKAFARALATFDAVQADFAQTPLAELAGIYRGVTFQRQGDTTAAIGAYEQFLSTWPDSEDAEYAKKQIAKLKGEEQEK